MTRSIHAANPIMGVIFNASQKLNQFFSPNKDRSRSSSYLRVPVSLHQHKCIRDFEWLWIVKPSVWTVSYIFITEILILNFLWNIFNIMTT